MDKIVKRSILQSKVLANSNISDSDVLIIWDAMCYYIRDEMSRKRGVVLPGFGTFTYVEHRIDIGNNKELLKLKPFFLLSDRFAQLHRLDFEKDCVNTSIPVSRINYIIISEIAKRKYSRDIVEAVLSEAFTAIDHFLRNDGRINVPFNGLGSLIINDIIPKTKKQTCFQFSSAMLNRLPLY
jgi:nucleoid DNA-binding protein